MANSVADNPFSQSSEAADRQALQSVKLKRQVTVKSLVTDTFRNTARTELTDEIKLIDAQLEQLETQYQASIRQIETMARSGQNMGQQMQQLNHDAQERRNQLSNVKMQATANLANLDKVQDGDTVVTGVLENYVEIKVGDNIYDKLRGAEIILEDGKVKSIMG